MVSSIPKPTIDRKDKPITSYTLYNKSELLSDNVKTIVNNLFKKSISLSVSKKITLMGALINSFIEHRKTYILDNNVDTNMTIYNYCDIFTKAYIVDMTNIETRKYICNDRQIFNNQININDNYTNTTLLDVDKYTSVSKNENWKELYADISQQYIQTKEEYNLLLTTHNELTDKFNQLLTSYNKLKDVYIDITTNKPKSIHHTNETQYNNTSNIVSNNRANSRVSNRINSTRNSNVSQMYTKINNNNKSHCDSSFNKNNINNNHTTSSFLKDVTDVITSIQLLNK